MNPFEQTAMLLWVLWFQIVFKRGDMNWAMIIISCLNDMTCKYKQKMGKRLNQLNYVFNTESVCFFPPKYKYRKSRMANLFTAVWSSKIKHSAFFCIVGMHVIRNEIEPYEFMSIRFIKTNTVFRESLTPFFRLYSLPRREQVILEIRYLFE